MQEQEVIINQEHGINNPPEPQKAREEELFNHYEIKNWEFSPRLYKIIAASAIFNVLAVVVFAQTNLLQAKACDSPLVSGVCQVLDTIYLGSSVLGTDSEFVSQPYDKTELEDAEITYIDVSSDTPPLTYPEGYFALANPESQQPMFEQVPGNSGFENAVPPFSSSPGSTSMIPPMTSTPGNSGLLGTTPNLPPVNKNPISGDLPDSPFGNSSTVNTPPSKRGNNKAVKPKDKSPNELPKVDGDEKAENKDKKDESKQPDIKSESVAEVVINKKPFEELGDNINTQLAKNEIDLNAHFDVLMEGIIKPDGTFDRDKSRFLGSKGDEQMINVAKDAIQAIGDSGFLAYLKNEGVDRIRLRMTQDDKQITISLVSEQKTPEAANKSASGLNGAISFIKTLDSNGFKKLDDNSKTLINNTKVTSQGKNFVLNFEIPKPQAQELIKKTLNERAEKKNKQTNNSSDLDADSNATLSE